MANESETGRRRVARLFDVRLVIGGLFVIYGVILTGMGLFGSSDAVAKAQGVHINTWMGLAMFVFGLLMLLWLRLSPPAGARTGRRNGHETERRAELMLL